jgi:hypothetical protein
VQMEDYDEGWVADAARWLDDVVYAYLQKEEARKEPPRPMSNSRAGLCRSAAAPDAPAPTTPPTTAT